MADKRGQNLRQTTLPSSNDNSTTTTTPDTPTNPTPTPTMATRRTATTPTIQEIIQQKNVVKDAVSGKTHLEKTALAVSGKPYSTDTLTEILLHITQIKGVPLPAQTAIRAVAFILEEQTELKIADSVAKLTIMALAPHIAQLQEEVSKISKATGEIATTPESNIRLDRLQQTIEQVAAQTKEHPATISSYKTALMAGVNPTTQTKLVNLAVRNAIKERQVLINIPQDSALALGKTSQTQLVEKIKKALETITKEGEQELTVKTVNRYPSGNIVLEMSNDLAAKYLREDKNKKAFISELEPNATIKDRSYTVILQFVPISFDPSQRTNITNLERENDWEEGAVLTARWIKPPGRRTDDQQVAHIIATIRDPQTANSILRDGFSINLMKLYAKKNKREPLRCAKCQFYGHFARECKAHKDTCGNCAGEHCTSECDNKRKR